MKRAALALALTVVSAFSLSAPAFAQTNGHEPDPGPAGVKVCGHGASPPVSVAADQSCPPNWHEGGKEPDVTEPETTVVTELTPTCPKDEHYSSMSPGGCFPNSTGAHNAPWKPAATTTTEAPASELDYGDWGLVIEAFAVGA